MKMHNRVTLRTRPVHSQMKRKLLCRLIRPTHFSVEITTRNPVSAQRPQRRPGRCRKNCFPNPDTHISSRPKAIPAFKDGTRNPNQFLDSHRFRFAQVFLQRVSSTGPTTNPQKAAPANTIQAEMMKASLDEPLTVTIHPARTGAIIPDTFPIPFCRLVQRPAISGPASVCVMAQ